MGGATQEAQQICRRDPRHLGFGVWGLGFRVYGLVAQADASEDGASAADCTELFEGQVGRSLHPLASNCLRTPIFLNSFGVLKQIVACAMQERSPFL